MASYLLVLDIVWGSSCVSRSNENDHAGPGGQNFFKRPNELHEMLAYPAQLYRLDVLHGKFDVFFGKKVSASQ